MNTPEITDVDMIYLSDALNVSLLEMGVSLTLETTIPNSNEQIIYVDKESSSNPTTDRKQY